MRSCARARHSHRVQSVCAIEVVSAVRAGRVLAVTGHPFGGPSGPHHFCVWAQDREELCQQGALMVEIGAVETRQIDQPIVVVKHHAPILEGAQSFAAQLPQHPVDVDRT